MRNEAGSPARKHHLVPASYLRRWAEDGKVRVTEVDERRTYVRSPETAARETDFYRLEHPELDKDLVPPQFYETLLSKVEGNAHRVAEALLKHGPAGMPNPESAALFALHLAVSVTRGRAFRVKSQELLNDYYRLQYANVTDAGIAKRLREAGIEPSREGLPITASFWMRFSGVRHGSSSRTQLWLQGQRRRRTGSANICWIVGGVCSRHLRSF